MLPVVTMTLKLEGKTVIKDEEGNKHQRHPAVKPSLFWVFLIVLLWCSCWASLNTTVMVKNIHVMKQMSERVYSAEDFEEDDARHCS